MFQVFPVQFHLNFAVSATARTHMGSQEAETKTCTCTHVHLHVHIHTRTRVCIHGTVLFFVGFKCFHMHTIIRAASSETDVENRKSHYLLFSNARRISLCLIDIALLQSHVLHPYMFTIIHVFEGTFASNSD